MSDRRNHPVVTEDMAHSAVEYLISSAEAAADAAGNLERADYHRKRIRAELILKAPHNSMGMREAWAESQEDYAEVCNKLADARRAVEWHRNMRSRAETICEMFRTIQANARALGRAA